MARPLPPPTPLNGQAISGGTFFAASLGEGVKRSILKGTWSLTSPPQPFIAHFFMYIILMADIINNMKKSCMV